MSHSKCRYTLLTLIIVKLRVLALGPLVRLGEQSVSHTVVWVVLEAHPRGRVPLGVLLAEPFLCVRSQLQLLTFPQLHYQDLCKHL